jgi:hypothetical protein
MKKADKSKSKSKPNAKGKTAGKYSEDDVSYFESVNILPSFVSEIIKESRDVQSVFLSDTHHDRIASVIYNRGLFGDAKTYSDHVKAKEVKWVKIYDAMIRHDAKVFNLPQVEISKDTSDIERLMRVIT